MFGECLERFDDAEVCLLGGLIMFRKFFESLDDVEFFF